MKSLAYGIQDIIPDDAIAAWGARAILRNGVMDIVMDRTDRFFAKGTAVNFAEWMGFTGLPWVNKTALNIWGEDRDVHRFQDGPFNVVCSAQGSHGYLYITAWMSPEAQP